LRQLAHVFGPGSLPKRVTQSYPRDVVDTIQAMAGKGCKGKGSKGGGKKAY